MKVSELLNFDSDLSISNLTLNSNDVVENSVFIALKGANHHGLNYAKSAIANGAIAILFDNEDVKLADEVLANSNVLKIPVTDLAKNLGNIAARFYDEPSQKNECHRYYRHKRQNLLQPIFGTNPRKLRCNWHNWLGKN